MESEQQRLTRELAEIQAQLDKLKQAELEANIEELRELAEEINRLVSEAKAKASAAGLYFEYSQGYGSFDVHQWEQSDYC